MSDRPTTPRRTTGGAAATRSGAGKGVALLCLLAVHGCDSAVELQYHGRRHVADGRYVVLDLVADGSGALALALDEARADALTILPFEGELCRVGPVAGYVMLSSPRGLRLATFDTTAGPRRLQVLNARCETKLPPLEDVVDLRGYDGRVLVTTAGGSLYALDPWTDSSRLVSDTVRRRGSAVRVRGDAAGSPRPLWLLEGEDLVLRDLEGRELRRAGDGVRELAVGGLGTSMIFSDSTGLYHVDEEGEVKRLSEPGCKLRYQTVVHERQGIDIAFMLSPCEDGRLVAVAPDGELAVLAQQVVSYFVRLFGVPSRSIESWLFYATEPNEGAALRHFMTPLGGDAFELDVPISSRSALAPVAVGDGADRAWLLTTSEPGSRFGAFTQGKGFSPLAEHARAVVQTPSGIAVLHGEGEAPGTLSRVTADLDLEALAFDVPSEGLFSSPFADGEPDTPSVLVDTSPLALSTLPPMHVVLHDYDGETGTLSAIEPARLRELGREVPLWSPQTYLTPLRGNRLIEPARYVSVLSFLEGYDLEAGSGTLSVLTPRGRVSVARDVTSHAVSSDPDRPGVLYATAEDEVWFIQQ